MLSLLRFEINVLHFNVFPYGRVTHNTHTLVSTVSVANIKDIPFHGCSEIMRTRNFMIFAVYTATSRGWLFSCSRRNRSLHVGPPVKGRYLIVDLLKSFSLRTIDEREIGRILELLKKLPEIREASI